LLKTKKGFKICSGKLVFLPQRPNAQRTIKRLPIFKQQVNPKFVEVPL